MISIKRMGQLSFSETPRSSMAVMGTQRAVRITQPRRYKALSGAEINAHMASLDDKAARRLAEHVLAPYFGQREMRRVDIS